MRLGTRLSTAVGLLAGIAACDHSQPFAIRSYSTGGPRTSGSAIQLTYNPGDDYGAAWLPDGSAFLYTTQRRDRPDHDQCLATMPAAGGTVTSEACNRLPAADDSTNAYFAPAVSRTHRLAYVRTSSPYQLGAIAPRYQELVVAPLAHPEEATVLRPFPYLGPSGRPHDTLDYLYWLSDSSLVYLAERVDYTAPCSSCAPDTVRTGLEIVRLEVADSQAPVTLVPGTDGATSLAVVSPDTVFFTLFGDSRVYELGLATDSLTVAFDFGAGRVPVGIQVSGHQLLAVVSEALWSVDRSTGVETLVTGLTGWRHLAPQPAANRLVADFVNADGTTDLWLLSLP